MNPPAASYRRESEETRRADLIAATQELVAEGGPEAATVRAIAARAGVTPGLIRHYFQTKDELTRAAYATLMDGMTAKGADALEGVGAGARGTACRLRRRLAAPAGAGCRGGRSSGRATCTRCAATPSCWRCTKRPISPTATCLQTLIAALPRDASDAQTARRGHRLQRA